ncbi:glycosyltransferase [Cohnella sp. GCM10012308]|uniref:glycosyltransferase n=1 Tax=Cohnella sp. GCM10012308 TaxID=3317329 RepID=UPI00360A0C62
MNKFAVVVIGYNRTDSISRLLASLLKADYAGEKVDLVISIDFSGVDNVRLIAEEYRWPFGDKIVKAYPQKLGLRKHILSCGDLLNDYDAIAVLEDDVYVSPDFFNFMNQAVNYYQGERNIAGISLYSHGWSEYNNRPFIPDKNCYDVYFMKYAQSWGQIWLKDQWLDFIDWYNKNNEEFLDQPHIPPNVSNWPASSWLKYHIKYCIEMNKYFVYPYHSLSTNFTDIGQHNAFKSTNYQIPIVNGKGLKYKFVDINNRDEGVFYDCFFERENLGKFIGLNDLDLCLDIYGGKSEKVYKRFLLTMEKKPYKIVKSFGLEMRPHEANITNQLPGEDIFLYDTSIADENNYIKATETDIKKWNYDIKSNDYRLMLKILIRRILSRFKIN